MSVEESMNGWKKSNDFPVLQISQPHAAYAAFVNGLVGRWTYLLRIISLQGRSQKLIKEGAARAERAEKF